MKIVLLYNTEGLEPDHFELLQDFILEASDGTVFVIEAGLITDGASVPGFAQGIIHPISRDLLADAFHDCYYMKAQHEYSRRQIDKYWLEFMKRFNPKKPFRTYLKYGYVRALGWYNWRYYRRWPRDLIS